jgi:hypothetical protein
MKYLFSVYLRSQKNQIRFSKKYCNDENGRDTQLSLGTLCTRVLRVWSKLIMELRPIVFKEWRDTRTFSNLKSTHCTLLILFIINLVTKSSLCLVSKVQREQCAIVTI